MSISVHTNSTARRSQWAQYLLAGGLLFLGLFLTRAAEQTRDSLVYAQAAKTGVEMFHPHHLIYTPIVRLFHQAVLPLCPACDAVFAGQIHNILWSVIGILALFTLARSVWSTPVALTAALFFLSLRGYWELSTQTTMYVPSAAILALLSAVLITANPKRSTLQQAGWIALLAALFALAILYHQANILFVLPLGVYFFAARGKTGVWNWLLVIGLAGLVTLIGYIVVYLVSTSAWSLSGFIRYCLSYTSEICLGGACKASPDGWGSLGNISPGGLQQLLSSLFWNILVIPARLEAILLPGFGLAVLALIGWHVIQTARRAAHRALRLYCLAWFASYTVFFFWWLPSYQHPFAAALLPLTLLVLLALQDLTARISDQSQARRLAAAAIAAAALLIAGRNFQARILPLHQSRGDAYQEAAALHAAAPPDCIFFTSYRTWNNLRYYFDRDTAIQAKHPLSFFYQNAPLPVEYQISDKPCVLVATTFLMPDYSSEDYSDDPISAYQDPKRWLAYLSWLLEIERSEQTPAVSSRDFAIMHIPEGTPYLRLLPTRRNAGNLDDLFQQIDSELNAPSQPFQSWYSLVR